MVELRQYQKEAARSCWSEVVHNPNSPEGLCTLPTGAGKTFIFSAIIKKLLMQNLGHKVLILINRLTLIDQTVKSLKTMMPNLTDDDIGIYCGSRGKRDFYKTINISMVQSLRQVTRFPFYRLVIVDEAHNFIGTKRFEELKNHLKSISWLYFTATPYAHGAPLDVNEVFKLKLDYLINQKHLVPYKLYSSPQSFDVSELQIRDGDFLLSHLSKITDDPKKIFHQVEDALSRLGDRKKVVWAACTIAHAEAIAQVLLSKKEIVSINHSKLSKKDQEIYTDGFEKGSVRHMVTVMKLSEGYDYPAIDAIVCMRPTRSANLYVQLLGRGLRNFEEKKDCIFLDYGEVCENLGSPNDPVLIRTKKDMKNEEERSLVCPACRFVSTWTPPEASPQTCSECGYTFKESQSRDVLKNLTSTAAGKTSCKTLNVIDVKTNLDYVSKSSNRPMYCVIYVTLDGKYVDYIAKEPRNHHEIRKLSMFNTYFHETKKLFKIKKIELDESNRWVRKAWLASGERVY